MSSFRLAPKAISDLEEILDYIASQDGDARAEKVRLDLVAAMRQLAGTPGMGRTKENVTARPVLFWSVHKYLIVYRPEHKPLEVVRILHGARDPEDLRRKFDE